MFSVLPDLTPRDSHSLWYVSSRNPNRNPSHLHPATQHGDGISHGAGANNLPNGPHQGARSRAQQAALIERSTLGRLRAEEAYYDRRRANVVNLGQTWLKPPGLTKTLHQMREERREAEEHAEAMRREQLAQDLAEAAEAQANADEREANPMDALDMDIDPDDPLLGGDEEVEVDLDDDIPDADEGGFGYNSTSEDDEEDEDEDEDGTEAAQTEHGATPGQSQSSHQRQAQRQEVANMRATEDRMREAMMRHQAGSSEVYGGDDLDETGQGQLLEEDDLVHNEFDVEEGMDMEMGADLDDDIPEAESVGYEHTDSDASLSDEDNGNVTNVSLTQDRSLVHASHASRARASMAATERSRNSLDINSLLSGDGSSLVGSSPHIRRRN